jgi:hypothetical protein
LVFPFSACSLPLRALSSVEGTKRLRILETAKPLSLSLPTPPFLPATVPLWHAFCEKSLPNFIPHFPTLFHASALYYTLPNFITRKHFLFV